MKDKEFFSRVLGLAEPWRVKEVRLDLEGKRVDVEIECRAGEVWAGEGGKRLHIHGWEQRQWRHLDTMQLETIIGCRVPRVVDPETGKLVGMLTNRDMRFESDPSIKASALMTTISCSAE